jgi:hypothetical protein
MLAALTSSFVDREWSCDEAYRRLMDLRNPGGAKLHAISHERGWQAAHKYFRQLWRQQVAFVREHPPINHVPSEVIARLDSVLATAALALPWTTRGHSLWALLAALVAVSHDAGSDLAFEASRRQLAERAGLSWRTTRKRLAELVEVGWVERIRRGIGTRGTCWRLSAPGTAVAAYPSNPGREAPLGGALRLLGSLVAPSHDALRWRAAGRAGLGKAAHRLLLILAVHGPTSATALVQLTSAKWSQIRRLRRKLAQRGVLEDGETLRVPPDVHLRIEQLAWSLGTAGAAGRQKRDHQHEREDYRRAWHPRSAAYRAEQRRRRKE